MEIRSCDLSVIVGKLGTEAGLSICVQYGVSLVSRTCLPQCSGRLAWDE